MIPHPTTFRRTGLAAAFRTVAASLAVVMASCFPALGGEQIASFNKAFSPATIGPGSVSTLTFTINNFAPTGARGLAFTDNLPPGIVIATPSGATSNCGGTLTAPDGGGTITLTDGSVPPNGSCTITVNVTGTTVGIHTNTTGDLTSDLGNSGPASAVLTVTDTLPGFSKSFSPGTIGLGGRATLTFTFDNSQNATARNALTFTDVLPAGMVVADPANASTTCSGGRITAVPGSSTISYATVTGLDASVGAGQVCTLSVDVIAQAVGALDNLSGELTSSQPNQFTPVSSGKATATLNVPVQAIVVAKAFTNDPVVPGGTVNLQYIITNRDRRSSATGITLSDDLGAVLPGLTAVGLPLSNVCGTGSQLTQTGPGVLVLSNGVLGPEETCTYNVTVQVPVTAEPGFYPSTSGPVQATVDGSPVSGLGASDTLFVATAPNLQKEFIDDPVTPGDEVTLRFRITNTSLTDSAFDIAFTDELPSELTASVSLPENGFCGPGSSLFFSPPNDFNPGTLTMSGGSLDPGATCSFDVVLLVDQTASSGIATNTTEPITATIAETTLTGNAATDDLVIVAAPRLTKNWSLDAARPGDIVELEYTLTHGVEAPLPATNISFTDDLGAVLAGMVATNLPQADVCGAGSSVTGTSVVSFTGGSLDPGESCTFSILVAIPATAPLGTVTNTTSPVSARVAGVPVRSRPATDDILITNMRVRKEFIDDPVIPGGTATLRFTIENFGTVAASGIEFTDNLGDVLPGLVATGLPLSDICGVGSNLQGTNFLIFTGGSVAAGESCSFDVTLQVPANAPDGQYRNLTSGITANVAGAAINLPSATDTLQVFSNLLQIEKSFDPPAVEPGGTTQLEFTITNLDPVRSIGSIGFTDNLPGLLEGQGTFDGVCGPLSSLFFNGGLTLENGSLGPGESCTFSVPISVPSNQPFGFLTNTTSDVTGLLGGLTVRGDPARANLSIEIIPAENNPPVAGPDTVDRNPASSIKIPAATLLANDTDPEGHVPLRVSAVNYTGGNGASVTLSQGTVFYNPNGHTGADSFTYTVQDRLGASSTGNVTVALINDTAPTLNVTGFIFNGQDTELVGAGIPDRAYRVQAADSASPNVWTTLAAVTADALGRINYTDPGPLPPTRIYRLVHP